MHDGGGVRVVEHERGRFLGAGDEEPHAVEGQRILGRERLLIRRQRQRRDAIDAFADDPQRFAARRKHVNARRFKEQGLDQSAAGVAEVLAVVEDQQRVLGAQRGDDEIHRGGLFGRIELHRRGQRGRDQRRIFDAREIDEPNALAEGADARLRGFDGESRLADAARTGERDQTNLAQQSPHFGEFAFAPEKARELQRQIMTRRETAQRRRRFRFVVGRRDDAIAPALFRIVRGFVGQLDDAHRFAAGDRRNRSHADADRNAPERRAVVIEMQLFDRVAHAFGHDDRIGQRRRRQDGGELFAAVAGEHVVGPLDARPERLRDLLQARVARDVAVAVVERLEVVDIDEDDRDVRLRLDAARVFADDPLVERAAIGDPGQPVARDEPLQRTVHALLARVVHAHREIKRARFEQLDVGIAVGVGNRALHREHADDVGPEFQRDVDRRDGIAAVGHAGQALRRARRVPIGCDVLDDRLAAFRDGGAL